MPSSRRSAGARATCATPARGRWTLPSSRKCTGSDDPRGRRGSDPHGEHGMSHDKRRRGGVLLGTLLLVSVPALFSASRGDAYEVGPVADGGVIQGKVTFQGAPPPKKKIIP